MKPVLEEMMRGLSFFKFLLVVIVVLFAILTYLVSKTAVMASASEIWNNMLAVVILTDLLVALFLFGCWAILRDGWLKGIGWMISFFILGSAGVAIYMLWNLRTVKRKQDLIEFLAGSRVRKEQGTPA